MLTGMRTALQTIPEKEVGHWEEKFMTQIICNE